MASGDPVLDIIKVMPPDTLFATEDQRAGGSTPQEEYHVWDFNPTVAWHMDFLCRLSENYSGGGLTLTLGWTTDATTTNVRWAAAFRRLDTAEDIDLSHTYDYNGVTAAAPSTSGKMGYPTITFTDGADMDNLAAGEFCILRIKRDVAHADDNTSGDGELHGVAVKET